MAYTPYVNTGEAKMEYNSSWLKEFIWQYGRQMKCEIPTCKCMHSCNMKQTDIIVMWVNCNGPHYRGETHSIFDDRKGLTKEMIFEGGLVEWRGFRQVKNWTRGIPRLRERIRKGQKPCACLFERKSNCLQEYVCSQDVSGNQARKVS